MSEIKKPWPMTVNNKDMFLFRHSDDRAEFAKVYPKTIKKLGLIAIAMFRLEPEKDYLAIAVPDEDSLPDESEVESWDGSADESWVFIFDRPELVIWAGGLALTYEEREGSDAARHLLHSANRVKGTFREQYGWRPDVVLEDKANDRENEIYINYIIEKEGDGPLYLPEDFDII